MDLIYAARIRRDRDGNYLVTFPDFPEASTFGIDRADALRMAADCLGVTIGARLEDREDIPAPSAPGGRSVPIPVPGRIAAKAALFMAMRDAGVSINALARRLRMQTLQVRRMLDPQWPSDIDRLEEALAVIGKRMAITIRDAA